MIFVSHVTLQDHVIEVSCNFYELELLIFCHHHVKFGIRRYYGSGDIMGLVCHVILQRLETRSKTLPSLVAIGTLLVDIMVFDYHLPLQDHMIRGSCDFMEERQVNHPVRFGGHRYCGSGNIFLLLFSYMFFAFLLGKILIFLRRYILLLKVVYVGFL